MTKRYTIENGGFIIIDGYRYVVENSEVKQGDWFLHRTGLLQCSCTKHGIDKKVIASNNPALPDLPRLPEPDGQEDDRKSLEKFLKPFIHKEIVENDQQSERLFNNMWNMWWGLMDTNIENGLINAFKAAKGKGTYSEDDMWKAYSAGGIEGAEYQELRNDEKWEEANKTAENSRNNFNDFLKSLKPEPIGVELEMEMETDIGMYYRTGKTEQLLWPKTEKVNGKDTVIVKSWMYE